MMSIAKAAEVASLKVRPVRSSEIRSNPAGVMIGLPGAENWAPSALSPKALRNGGIGLRTTAAVALQAQVESLLSGLETAVVGALAEAVGKTAMDVESGSLELVAEPVKDIESGFELAEELGKALVLGLVEDARRLLSKKAAKLISEAAKGVAFTAALRLFKNTRPAVGKKETDGLLSKAGRIAEGVQLKEVVQDVKAQLLQVSSGSTECGMLITAAARESGILIFQHTAEL